MSSAICLAFFALFFVLYFLYNTIFIRLTDHGHILFECFLLLSLLLPLFLYTPSHSLSLCLSSAPLHFFFSSIFFSFVNLCYFLSQHLHWNICHAKCLDVFIDMHVQVDMVTLFFLFISCDYRQIFIFYFVW